MEARQNKQSVEILTREATSPLTSQTHPWRGTLLALAITIFCWASAFVGIRAGLHGYSPTHLALLRYLVASLVLALYAMRRRMPLPQWRDVPGLAFCGLIGIAIYNVALNTGEVSVSASISSFLVNTAPILTALLSMLLLKERLSLWGWGGILVCLIGISLMTLSPGEGFHLSVGMLLILSAALAQSLSFVWQKPYLARYSALQCTTCTIWTGTLGLLLFFPGLITNMRAASWSETAAVIYLGIFPAALGYVSYAYALARIPATHAASFLYLVPAVTLGIAWVWLSEWPSWFALLGGGIAIAGVMIVNRYGKTQVRKIEAF
jgi:drug/metabolite transporter (DMT)-like permease